MWEVGLPVLPQLPFPTLLRDGSPMARLRRFRSAFFCPRQRRNEIPRTCGSGGLLLLWGFAYFSFFLRLRDLVRIADAPTREVKHRALHMPRWDSSAVFGLEVALAKTIS